VSVSGSDESPGRLWRRRRRVNLTASATRNGKKALNFFTTDGTDYHGWIRTNPKPRARNFGPQKGTRSAKKDNLPRHRMPKTFRTVPFVHFRASSWQNDFQELIRPIRVYSCNPWLKKLRGSKPEPIRAFTRLWRASACHQWPKTPGIGNAA
jgi:hypothetical protein